MRALPGGYVGNDETLEQAVYKKVKEKTNVDNAYLEQLYTFSDIDRDPRGRYISCSYMALMREKDITLTPGIDTIDVQLFSIDALPDLAFDHQKIINYALERLQYKLEYTNIVQYLLPESFTLTELHITYESILHKELDIRNFKKKILKINVVQATGEKVIRGVHRPAMLYRFINTEKEIIEMM